MKKIVFMLSALLAAFTAGARSYPLQNDTPVEVPADTVTVIETRDTRTDTVKVRTNKTDIVVIERDGGKTEVTTYGGAAEIRKEIKTGNKSFGMGTQLLDLGFGNYSSRNFISGADGGGDFLSLNTSKSVGLGVYLISVTAGLTRNKALELQTALGIEWNNYRFEQGWNIANADGSTVATDKYRNGYGYSLVSKSKLTTAYMNAPLLLKWNIMAGGKPTFHVSGGVIGGLKLGSRTKVKYYDGGGKRKGHDSYNLSMLTWDLTLRAGYRGLGVFFNYQMNPLFEKRHGPELYPYTVGLSIAMFNL